MKKILVISDCLSGRGGIEKVVKDFYHHFHNNEQYQVELLILNSTMDTQWLHNIHFNALNVSEYVKQKRKKSLMLRATLQGQIKQYYKNRILSKKLEHVILEYSPDIILSTGYLYLNLVKNICVKNNLNTKLLFWDHMSHSYYLAQNKTFLKNVKVADHYFAICTGIERSLYDLGISQHKISLIYNPIEQQQELKRTTEKIKFIYVGRLFCYQQKRCMDILHAIEKIKALNFTFEFYGDGQDRIELEQTVQQLGLQDKVKFLGWFDKPWQTITEASCLILPSQYEGLPLVLGEAISYGIPCLASDCKFGPEDIISEGINGSLFEVGDVEALASKMEQFITNPKKFYNADKIKDSISYLYRENYFKNLEKILEHL